MMKSPNRYLIGLMTFIMIFSLIVVPTQVNAVLRGPLEISVPNSSYVVGDTFTAQVKVSNVTFSASQITVYFNPAVLQVVDSSGTPTATVAQGLISNTAHMTGGGGAEDWAFSNRTIDNTKGLVDVGIYEDPSAASQYTVTSAENYIGIRFKVIGNGNPKIHFATATSPAHTPANPNGYIFALNGVNASMSLITPTLTIGSSAKVITEFGFTGLAYSSAIDQVNHTINVEVASGTNVTALVPYIVFTGKSISPASGVAQDFTNPVTYTVTAEDDSTQDYVVTVGPPAPDFTPGVAEVQYKNLRVLLEFDQGVFGNAEHTTAIDKDDFTLTYNPNGSPLTNVTINGLNNSSNNVPAPGNQRFLLFLTLSGNNGLATGAETITITPKADSIYNADGIPAPVSATTGPLHLNDTTPQSFTAAPGDPCALGSKRVNVGIYPTENGGKFYIVIVNNNATAPTSAEVMNGTGSAGATPHFADNGAIETNGSIMNILLPDHDTDYDAYVVVTDAAENASTPPALVNVKTPRVPSSDVIVTSGTYSVTSTTTIGTITGVPFGTSKTNFLAALTKHQEGQVWNTDNIANPVVTGNTLVVTAEDGTQKTYQITVDPQIMVSQINVTGTGGATAMLDNAHHGSLQMLAEVLPANAYNKLVTWSVIDGTGSAHISSSGLLDQGVVGTVTVRATAQDGSGISDEMEVTVRGVRMSSSSASLTVGETKQLTAEAVPNDTTDFTWHSSNTAIATVDSNGLVKAVAKGTVNIMATTADGREGICAITVKSSSVPGGGGGGGSTFTGTLVVDNQGGTVGGGSVGAELQIPAGAMGANFKIKVEVTSSTGLNLPDNSTIIGSVVEITKDIAGNFKKAIIVTLKFDKNKVDLNKVKLTLCFYDTKTGKWVELKNVKVDAEKGTVSGEVDHLTKFAIIATDKEQPQQPPVTPPVQNNLTDITGHWAAASITQLVNSGAISGYPDNTFRPDASITRAEFASILVKAFKLAPKDGKVFADTAAHWAKDSIATAQAYGIINGYSDSKFGPDDQITREQMAVMIFKAAQLTAAASDKNFSDKAKIASWAKEAVNTAVAKAIITGYPDNTFRPQGATTRAEAATVIINALK